MEAITNADVTDLFLLEESALQNILEQSFDISGVWLLPKLSSECPPVFSLRLPKSLGRKIKSLSQPTTMPNLIERKLENPYFINFDYFKRIIQGGGFGKIYWNEAHEHIFVTIQIVNEQQVEEFIRYGCIKY